MGYNVILTEADFVIPQEQLSAAFAAMCALNHDPEIEKRGGEWSGGEMKAQWFSWMSPTYDKECKDAADVLTQLGFEVELDEQGDLLIRYYDSKTGQEELFIDAIAPFAKPGSYLIWQGEDGEYWRERVVDGKIERLYGRVIFSPVAGR